VILEDTKTTLSQPSVKVKNLMNLGGRIDVTKTGEVTRIFIPGEVPSSKNSQQICMRGGRRILSKSKFASQYDKKTLIIYKESQPIFLSMIPYEYPLFVLFQFIRRTNGVFDYCNLVQSVQDQMTRANWIPDDRMTYLVPVFIPYYKDKDNPGVWISIVDKGIFVDYE